MTYAQLATNSSAHASPPTPLGPSTSLWPDTAAGDTGGAPLPTACHLPITRFVHFPARSTTSASTAFLCTPLVAAGGGADVSGASGVNVHVP
eukprot:CAMPEP_0174747702 /NCGR_PEP_ID=MMETSP1094-20130205/91880_1 /TAXON_ID=156173 /ORGANISM="Chrysochromulina brevifilum, Strain UTEX LB 985" /LENGTH=91 /DNA_ID=CAMNT_0015952633 /DNA_START=148 /DNA_END=423 /DNA_ORIENTATION=+